MNRYKNGSETENENTSDGEIESEKGSARKTWQEQLSEEELLEEEVE